MEETDLLKEITYLSRLIGKHKHNLTTESKQPCSYSTSCNKQHIKNVKSKAQPPFDSKLKFPSASQLKVNISPQGRTVKQEDGETFVISDKNMSKDGVSTSNMVQNISEYNINQNEKQYEKVKSIHVNPRYLSNSTQIHHIPAYLKSVHVNPRIISMDKENGSVKEIVLPINENAAKPTVCKKVYAHVNPKIIPITKEHTFLRERIVLPAIKNDVKPVCKKDLSPVPALTKQPYSRRKFIFQSKTKLVKALGGTVPFDIKKEKSSPTTSSIRIKCQIVKKPAAAAAASLKGDTLLAVSRTKLVRVSKTKSSSEIKPPAVPVRTSTPVHLSNRQYKLRKALFSSSSSHAVKVAKKVSSKYRTSTPQCSKYKVDHRAVKTPKPMKNCITSRYQIDRRTDCLPFRLKRTSPRRRVPAYSHLIFSPVRRLSYGNRVWSAPFTPITKIKISHKRLSRIGSSRASGSHTQNSALVRIGGVLYRTSPTHLARSKPTEKTPAVQREKLIVKKRKLNTGQIVYVRGKKFIMDSNGKTLRTVEKNSSLHELTNNSPNKGRGQIRRVDIGGVTFVQKTPTLLIRTNTHTARNVLSIAKQKSIAVLTKKMRKNNQLCLFYRRFGKCPRQKKGRCELVHDRKYVTICKKHIQGKCDTKDCLLSHEIIPEKMPTCKFFLEGCCVRDTCPYVHVKVNSKAPLCTNFLKGFCPDGTLCLKRHFMVCPEFDKNGQCRKGKYCPYPHPKPPKVKQIPVKYSEDKTKVKESPKTKRYYESDSILEELKAPSDNFEVLSPGSYSDGCETPKKRSKLGDLPSFIALSSPDFS